MSKLPDGEIPQSGRADANDFQQASSMKNERRKIKKAHS